MHPWLQDYVDHMQPITRKDIVLAVLKGWEEMPESVILNAYSHLPTVHKGIVERRGGNRCGAWHLEIDFHHQM